MDKSKKLQQLIQDLRACAARSVTDEEQAHRDADAILIRYIDNVDVKDAFESIKKWYV